MTASSASSLATSPAFCFFSTVYSYMSHIIPNDGASLQRLINDIHIRLQAIAMEWADVRRSKRQDILRPYWTIGLQTEIVCLFWMTCAIG